MGGEWEGFEERIEGATQGAQETGDRVDAVGRPNQGGKGAAGQERGEGAGDATGVKRPSQEGRVDEKVNGDATTKRGDNGGAEIEKEVEKKIKAEDEGHAGSIKIELQAKNHKATGKLVAVQETEEEVEVRKARERRWKGGEWDGR